MYTTAEMREEEEDTDHTQSSTTTTTTQIKEIDDELVYKRLDTIPEQTVLLDPFL